MKTKTSLVAEVPVELVEVAAVQNFQRRREPAVEVHQDSLQPVQLSAVFPFSGNPCEGHKPGSSPCW